MIIQQKDLDWSKKMRDGERHTTPENVSLFFDESMYRKDPGTAPPAQVSAPKKKVVPTYVPPPDDQTELGNFFQAKSQQHTVQTDTNTVGQTETTTAEPLEQASAEQTRATPAEQPSPEQTKATSAYQPEQTQAEQPTAATPAPA